LEEGEGKAFFMERKKIRPRKRVSWEGEKKKGVPSFGGERGGKKKRAIFGMGRRGGGKKKKQASFRKKKTIAKRLRLTLLGKKGMIALINFRGKNRITPFLIILKTGTKEKKGPLKEKGEGKKWQTPGSGKKKVLRLITLLKKGEGKGVP